MARILLVDDEPDVRGALGALVEQYGHEFKAVANGREALVALHEESFDVVLCDVLMPRMNGFELLERVLPYVEERLPFVFLSSVRTEPEIRDALFAGAFDYLAKPCRAAELGAVLERAIAHHEAHREPGRPGLLPAEALGPTIRRTTPDLVEEPRVPLLRSEPEAPEDPPEAVAPAGEPRTLGRLLRRLVGTRRVASRRRAG